MKETEEWITIEFTHFRFFKHVRTRQEREKEQVLTPGEDALDPEEGFGEEEEKAPDVDKPENTEEDSGGIEEFKAYSALVKGKNPVSRMTWCCLLNQILISGDAIPEIGVLSAAEFRHAVATSHWQTSETALPSLEIPIHEHLKREGDMEWEWYKMVHEGLGKKVI